MLHAPKAAGGSDSGFCFRKGHVMNHEAEEIERRVNEAICRTVVTRLMYITGVLS